METLNLIILSVRTAVEEDRYERPKDIGNSGIFSTPKQFVVSFECETVVKFGEEPEKVYFNHRFSFSELMSKHGGCISCNKESDFVIYLEGVKKEHVGGLRNDETYFTQYGDFHSKFQEGERIYVKGTVERKTSKAGNLYIQMKRVKVDRNYCFHVLKGGR